MSDSPPPTGLPSGLSSDPTYVAGPRFRPPTRRRRRRIRRRTIVIIAAIVLFIVASPVIALYAIMATIDPNAYRPRIEAAAYAALGRSLLIRGPITLQPSLTPTITLHDVVLANMEGGSRPDMAKVGQISLDVALRSLLSGHLVISRLAIENGDLLLERNAQGVPNWRFGPPGGKATGGAAAADGGSGTGGAPVIALQTIHLRNITITWRGTPNGPGRLIDIPRFSATAASPDSPVAVAGEVRLAQQPIYVSAQTGPLSRLLDTASESPWGLFANFDVNRAKLTIAGTITRPLAGRGYSVRIDAAVPDLSALDTLLGASLPPLRDVRLSVRLLDQGGVVPDISALTLDVGASNLGPLVRGLSIQYARISLPRLADPLEARIEGTYALAPLRLDAALTGLTGLLPTGTPGAGSAKTEPLRIDASARIAGGTFAAKGSLADPRRERGLDINVGARIPDLAAFSVLAGVALPAVTMVSVNAHLADAAGGLTRGILASRIVLTAPQADVSGALSLLFGARPHLAGSLVSTRIDLDTLLAAIHRPGVEASDVPLTDSRVLTPPSVPRASGTLIPDAPLPLTLLRRADLDLSGRLGTLIYGGTTYRMIAWHLTGNNGMLTVAPFQATLPGGPITARLAIGPGETPQVALGVKATALNLADMLRAYGLPARVTGTLSLAADLHGAGDTPHAIAASLSGPIGASITGGTIDNALLGAVFAQALRAIGQVGLGPTGGTTALRCVALRLQATRGVANVTTGLADTPPALATLAGTMDLGNETVGLTLRSAIRAVGGAGVVVPTRLTGPWRAPRLTVESAASAAATARSAAGSALGALSGLLGGKARQFAQSAAKAAAPPLPANPCPTALPTTMVAVPGLK